MSALKFTSSVHLVIINYYFSSVMHLHYFSSVVHLHYFSSVVHLHYFSSVVHLQCSTGALMCKL